MSVAIGKSCIGSGRVRDESVDGSGSGIVSYDVKWEGRRGF